MKLRTIVKEYIYLYNTQFGEIVRRFKAIGSRRASWVRQKRAETTRKIGPAFPGAIIEALVLPFLRFYVTTVIRPFQIFSIGRKALKQQDLGVSSQLID